MAITFIAQPQFITPVYNPVVYQMYSDLALNYGFRFRVTLEDSLSDRFYTSRVAPDSDGKAIIDISKILQSKVDNITPDFNSSYQEVNGNVFEYSIKIIEEYLDFVTFTDYEFQTGDVTRLVGVTTTSLSIGDVIQVRTNSTYTDNRKLLNGFFTIIDKGTTWIEIDIPYSSIGDFPTTPGKIYSATAQYVSGDDEEITNKYVFNAAWSFKDWPNWDYVNITPVVPGQPTISEILTDAPDYLSTSLENDKWMIKPYQKLWWNFYDNSLERVTTLVAVNNLGESWIQRGTSDEIMKQWDVSPTADWISVSPNYPLTPNYQDGFPADFINVYENGMSQPPTKVEWYDVFPVSGDGYDDCDSLTVTFTINSGSPITYTYTAKVFGQGYNGKRQYTFLGVDGKTYIIRYEGLNNWVIRTSETYDLIPQMTNNTSPTGNADASSNSTFAFRAFDNDPLTSWTSIGGFTGSSIEYKVTNATVFGPYATCVGYAITKPSINTNAPKSWTVQVFARSTNSWFTVNTVTNHTTLGRTYFPFPGFGLSDVQGIRLVFSDVISGTNVEVVELELIEDAKVARMSSASDCPSSGGFLIWQNLKFYPQGTTALWTTTSIAFNENPTLKPFRIFLDHKCVKNEAQLLFRDRHGSYSSFAFPLNIKEQGTVQRQSYKNNIGMIVGSEWTYNTFDSERKVFDTIVEKTLSLSTDWINEGMSNYFEQLFSSPEVYYKEGDSPWLAVTVEDEPFENPRSKTRKLINRTIKVKFNSNNPINV